MQSIHYVRRHRRRLFYPMGLLLLAWLPLLTAFLYREYRAEHPIRNVLQVTVPRPYQPALSFSKDSRLQMPSPTQLARLADWETIDFTGNRGTDSLSQLRTLQYLRRHLRRPLRQQGLKLRFGPSARYRTLVWALNLANQCEIRRYLLDLHAPVPTLYLLTTISSAGPLPAVLQLPASSAHPAPGLVGRLRQPATTQGLLAAGLLVAGVALARAGRRFAR